MKVIVIGEKWDKSKLVQKLVRVRLKKKGTEYYRKQWVRKDYNSIGNIDRDTIGIMERDLRRRLKEKGEIGREAYYKGVIEPIGKEIARELKRRIEDSGQEELEKGIEELKNKINDYYREIMLKSNNELRVIDRENDIYYKKIDKLAAQVYEKEEEYEAKKKELREIMLGELRRLREFGSTPELTKKHLGNSKSKIRDSIEEAMRYYPTDWLKESAKRGKLTIRKAKDNERGKYIERGYDRDEIVISNGTKERQLGTALHELGHRMEASGDQELYAYEDIFYRMRTAGEMLESLKSLTGLGYSSREMTRKDKFLDPYMGKEYLNSHHYELFTVGFQMGVTEPEKLLQDLDMSAFIYGCLAVLHLNNK